MLVFGHAGITLGAATLIAGAMKYKREPETGKISWFTSLSSYIDIRILLVGSLLPDIIDKPVGQYILRETFSYGRLFAHSLLFLIVVTAAGFYLYQRHKQVWLLTLSFGIFTHLILDSMWTTPRTLFWPFLGFTFDRAELTDWFLNIWHGLLTYPEVYIPELIGLLVILWFGILLIFRKRVGSFLKHGKSY